MDFSEINLRYINLINRTDTSFVRYLYEKIDWNSRMISIAGARGTGKTTMLLQHIRTNLDISKSLYVSADDIFFSENKLYYLAEEFVKYGGKHLFIDEIHKYKGWSNELKMMYDNLPNLQVVFTGSSILEIYKGQADLSRRVLSYNMLGLSFREFLNLRLIKSYTAYSLEQVLTHSVRIEELPLPLFKEYLENGYYPFFLEDNYSERLRNVLNLTLEVDIPSFIDMNISTTRKLKQLLYIIAQSVPFKPNLTKIGEQMGVHRNQVAEYLVFLEKAGLVNRLLDSSQGLGSLGKVQKVYLNNTNIIKAIASQNANIGNVRETFFLSQTSSLFTVKSSIYADFQVEDKTFEVGGKHKKQTQIKEIANGFIVKDDIEYGIGNIIPLWAFGFLY